MSLNLNGLIPATVLPMDADGRIEHPALRRYIDWIAAQGPVALAINVDTGEGPHLTVDEKVRVLEIVNDTTDLPIVAGLAGPSTEAAVSQAKRFKAAGADAFLVVPIPAYLSEPLDPRVPVQYHEAIARSVSGSKFSPASAGWSWKRISGNPTSAIASWYWTGTRGSSGSER
jgi:dihydrodipicolinate synthase/N-acetylneuraminate lyase